MVMFVRRNHADGVVCSYVVRRDLRCTTGFPTSFAARNAELRHRRGREAGYTMVMFVVVMAVMSIMMGVAVQTAEFQMKREREAELIFRGNQYVEAIRLFKMKYGRYPMRLKELYDAKPRVIRKPWKDPITDSDNWGIVFLGQEGRQLAGPGAAGPLAGDGGRPFSTQPPFGTGDQRSRSRGPGDRSGEAGQQGRTGERGMRGFGDDGPGDVHASRRIGPVVGVHSLSCDDAVKIYEGRTTYCEWRFIYREDQRGGGPGQPRPRPGPRPLHAGEEREPGWDDFIRGQEPDRGAGNAPLFDRGAGSETGGSGSDAWMGRDNPPGAIRTPRP
jgi:type II secretory pathway pseudopilin PulG